ncbi:MAG: branched-chain amino acid ABC transporter permease [Rhizobiaceae bacterium]
MWFAHGRLLTVLAWVALFILPLVLSDWNAALFAQYVTYGIFALSLALIWGGAGILSFGQAIFFGLGAYSMALVTLGKLPLLGDSAWVGLLLALIIPTLAAAVLGWILFQGRALAGAQLGIVTLCAAFVAEIAARRWDFVGGFNGLFGIPPMTGLDGDILSGFATSYVVLGAALLSYLIALAVLRSPLGTVLAAIRNNETRTAHFGYDVRLYKIFVFALSGALAGLAGAVFALQFGFVSPTLIGFGLSTEALIWVAVGGRGVLMAAFLGALIVRSSESVLSSALDQYWLLALGIVFVATVVFAPQGLLGNVLRLPSPRRFATPKKIEEKSRSVGQVEPDAK